MHRKPLNNALRRAKRGFTLIELMVVIVILGILGTAGLFFFQGAIGDAEYGRAGSEISALADGAKTYQVKNRDWPESVEALSTMSDSSFNTEDPWGTPYEFRKLDGAFEIRSAGEDKQMESADDIYWNSKGKPQLYNPKNDPENEMNQNQGGGAGGEDL